MDIIGATKFNELITTSDKLIMVDFRAEWCGPCRILKPVLEQLAEKYADKVELVKIDVDAQDNYPLAVEYQVNSIPQVTFFKNGVKVDQFIGVVPPVRIDEIINQHAGDMAIPSKDSPMAA
ncbi:thioredoxin [Patescibacteria group bacterium]|nr:thioredoxin [Patescibacteria group bacterium]